MPFIGKDWRSPGEAWVKTESLGWQRMKIIESQLHPSCHQSHPACSWPPRAQFGQHMSKNCNKENDFKLSGCSSSSSGGCAGSSPSSETSRSSGSEGSSCAESVSTTPTGSPEKNNGHHLHPITISSPYGRYSCCSQNHRYPCDHMTPSGSPKSATTYYYQDGTKSMAENYQLQHNQGAQMSRSLSREFAQSTKLTSDVALLNANSQKLRFNNSCSDLTNLYGQVAVPSDDGQAYHTDDETQSRLSDSRESSQQQQTLLSSESFPNADYSTTTTKTTATITATDQKQANNQTSSRTTPILMRNGSPMEDGQLSCHRKKDDNSIITTVTSRDDRPINEGVVASNNLTNDGSYYPGSSDGCTVCCCCSNNQISLIKEQQPKTAPHCRISVRTREVAIYNTISEAFYRLDFCNAIHDIRRFNYICKLLHLLITQNLTSLSGCATKVLFTMLEQVAWEVSVNKRNIHVLKNLLTELRQMIRKYYCWGRPIGSSLLWQQHFDTIERISRMVDSIELSPPRDDGKKMTFDKLPTEMVREILLRLNDYRDLVNSAQASPLMRTMIDSQYIWQKLCRYHFTDQQLRLALKSYDPSKSTSLVGVKYARTASADGQGSFRNPVAHARRRPVTTTAFAQLSSTRQQIEQTSERRCPSRRVCQSQNSPDGSQPSSSSSSSSSISTPPATTTSASASYVTNAIRIFDRESSSSAASCSNRNCDTRELDMAFNSNNNNNNINDNRKIASNEQKDSHHSARQTNIITKKQQNQAKGNSVNNNRQRNNDDIDWERVFHQLRKRYDLKEEYADCLLLCRHCRCLFWRSFGHPCIKNTDNDVPSPETLCTNESSGNANQQPSGGSKTNHRQSSEIRSNLNPGNDTNSGASRSRQTVASLSRSFDRGANLSGGENSTDQAGGSSNEATGNRATRSRSRQPLNELNGRQPVPPPGALRAQVPGQEVRPINNRMNANAVAAAAAANRVNNNNSANNNPASANRQDELVPNHVTITPQAFLKFFSL